ncbi:MAG: lipoyl(octanoyl) transferase LipB [Actinobacteria bacterium]|nr:lipoyl(octanoyl) transferase LipB [Actinomycetota bacterium]
MRVRDLGTVAYAEAFEAMRRFTAERGPTTVDEVWLLDHPPVYTLGLNGKPIHVLDPGTIPLYRSDRGGQVTYHGPGQLVVYVLLDLARRGLGLRRLVYVLEQAVIDLCAGFGVEAERRAGAPGVYAGGAKLAALGLRVRRGCSYHGLALNVDMELAPYAGIDPCGYAGLCVTRLRDLRVAAGIADIKRRIMPPLLDHLGYPHPEARAARHAA